MQDTPASITMVDKAGGVEFTNLLEMAPGSWLLALISILPAEDRLSLFQVSTPLASTVLHCAAKVKLRFCISRAWQLTPGKAEVRRSCVRQLLQKLQGFAVYFEIRHDSPAPIPTALSSQVGSLELWICEEASPANACKDWHALNNLSELVYRCCVSNDQNVSILCDALEAGRMQKLTSLTFKLGSSKLADSVLERLAHALGKQLQHLSTSVAALLTHLPVFEVLQTIHIFECTLTSLQAQRLCEHTSLYKVHIDNKVAIEGNHSQRTCGWNTLVIDPLAWEVLVKLPLAGLQNICAEHGISNCNEQENHVIENVLSQHGHKFTCRPGKVFWAFHGPLGRDRMHAFTLHFPSKVMLPLLAHLHVTCKLCLLWDGSLLDVSPPPSNILNTLWKALPTCVPVIMVQGYCLEENIIAWAELWQGLPEHVHTIEIVRCVVPAADLCMLLRTAPKHISNVLLIPCSTDQCASWEAAGLHGCVPAHVTLWTGPVYKYHRLLM